MTSSLKPSLLWSVLSSACLKNLLGVFCCKGNCYCIAGQVKLDTLDLETYVYEIIRILGSDTISGIILLLSTANFINHICLWVSN